MSTIVRPSGPLPARVYWFRRLLLLLVVLAVVFWLSRSIGTKDQPAAASTNPTAAAATAPVDPLGVTHPGARPVEHHSKHSRTKGGRNHDRHAGGSHSSPVVEPPPAEPDGPCRPAEVRLKPLVSAHNEAGDTVEIRLQLRTTGRAACTLSLGPANLLVKVISGTDQWWTSALCPAALFPSQLVVRAGEPVTYRVAWSGRRSAVHCRARTAVSTPGTYVAQAALIGGEPAQVRFILDPARGHRPSGH